MEERVTQLEEELTQLKAFIFKDKTTTEDTFRRNLVLLDVDIKLSSSTGTKIGTATTQKLGFFNHAPVVQQGAVTTPSGGGGSSADAVDQTSRTAIGQIKTALVNLGLIAP